MRGKEGRALSWHSERAQHVFLGREGMQISAMEFTFISTHSVWQVWGMISRRGTGQQPFVFAVVLQVDNTLLSKALFQFVHALMRSSAGVRGHMHRQEQKPHSCAETRTATYPPTQRTHGGQWQRPGTKSLQQKGREANGSYSKHLSFSVA